MSLNLELYAPLATPTSKTLFSRLDTMLFSLMVSIALTSLCLTALNHWFWHYPGNNYFPDNTFSSFIALLLIWQGCTLIFPPQSAITRSLREIVLFFTILCCIALMTNAIQLTPFKPIDPWIIQLEKMLHLNLLPMMDWAAQFPTLNHLLHIGYSSLEYQMACLPLLGIMNKQYHRLRIYYCLLLVTTLLGFMSYYFFPTTGPASHLHSALFTTEQYATGLKFYQIHHGIAPSTIAGGLIAMPSYHTIWALLSLYLAFPQKILFLGLLPLNGLLIMACVCLGWHYVLDILVASLIVSLSYLAIRFCLRK